MKKKCICILTSLLLLCSCESVPTNIANDAASGNEIVIADEQPQLVSFSDIDKNSSIKEIVSANYDNLTFDKNIDFTLPESIGSYQVICIDNFQNKSDLLFNEYVPNEILSSNTIIDDKSTYPYGPYIYDEKEDSYYGIGCTGFLNINYKCSVTNSIPFDATAVKSKYIGSNSKSDDNEAVFKSAAAFSEKIVSLFNYQLPFAANSVTTYKYNSDELYYIDFKPQFKEMSIFDIQVNNSNNAIAFPCGAAAVVDSSGEVLSYIVQNAFEQYGDGISIDEVVSPQSAAKLFSKKISGKIQYTVSEMDIVYIPTYKENIQPATDNESSHREKNQWASICSYDVLQLTPYWLFVIDSTPESEIIGLVSCVDGSVEFINNKKEA